MTRGYPYRITMSLGINLGHYCDGRRTKKYGQAASLL